MDNKNIFAERMKEARLKADLSQAELSRRTKISAATLSTYESTENPKNPPIDKAIAIAQELNVSLDWLCGLNDKGNNTSNEITFDNVMEAIMLLASLKQVTFATQKRYSDDYIYSEIPIIEIDSQILKNFITEYQKIAQFIKTTDYDDYLKKGLKKAIIDKFSNYIVNGGVIQSKSDGTEDSGVPFDKFDTFKTPF